MAPPTLVPDRTTLRRWRDAGYTQKQMAEMTLEVFGNKVSRAAIAAAMRRYGLSDEGYRYEEYIPWQVAAVHATAHPLRMLRLLGRRSQGGKLNSKEDAELESWLEWIADEKCIVAYDPDDLEGPGFYYIDAKYRDHRKRTIPVRWARVHMASPRRVVARNRA